MSGFENILKNYAITKGREAGRLKKLPKTSSFGLGSKSYKSSSNEVVFLDTSDWDRVTKLMKDFGLSLKRSELISLIKRSIQPTLDATKRETSRIETEAIAAGRESTGNLHDSIGFITGRSKEFVNIQVGPRVKRGFKGFHGRNVEFGTRNRVNSFGQNRGSARANPFMKPSFDKTFPTVVSKFKNEVSQYIELKANQIF
jgi:hypothetical protein